MKLKFLTNQIKFDIEIWNLNQTQIKFWRFEMRFDSNSNLLACQELELDSSSSSSRNFRLANRVKSTHSSLKLDLTISLLKSTIVFECAMHTTRIHIVLREKTTYMWRAYYVLVPGRCLNPYLITPGFGPGSRLWPNLLHMLCQAPIVSSAV